MSIAFYLAAAVALLATLQVITRSNPVHALLYLVVSLLAVAVIFLLLGAPFAAALEVMVYAGAIMVLFVFVVMMLNAGPDALNRERSWLRPGIWLGPGVLAGILLTELLVLLQNPVFIPLVEVGPKAVGIALMGPYLLAVELASLLLLAGLVGAYHLSRHYLRAPPDGAPAAEQPSTVEEGRP